MHAEYTYIVLFVLIGVFLILAAMRLFRAAGRTISQLRYEARRDRLQHKRIADEKYRQWAALNKEGRKIGGTATKVHWDSAGSRAQRQYHLEQAADEVFDPTSKNRGMDVLTPWGWPSSAGKRLAPAGRVRKPAWRTRIRNLTTDLFRSKQVIDAQHRARQQRNIRALLEDRYGRAGHTHVAASEIEWSKPQLPPELIRERQTDQMLLNKDAGETGPEKGTIRALQLVTDSQTDKGKNRKAAGE